MMRLLAALVWVGPAVVAAAAVMAEPAQAEVQKVERKSLTLTVSSEEFARRGDALATFADLSALVQLRVPAEDIPDFLRSPERVGRLLNTVLLTEAMVQRAQAENLISDPEVQARLYRQLAEAIRAVYLAHHLQSQLLDDYEPLAREIFMTNPASFAQAPSVEFEHLFVLIDSVEAEVPAMQRVLDIQASIDADATLEALLQYLDEETGERQGSGLIPLSPIAELLPVLGRQLQANGAERWSPPLRSQYGWHFVRLVRSVDATVPEWSEVREDALARAEARHRQQLEQRLLRDVQDGEIEFQPYAVIRFLEMFGVEGFPISALKEAMISEN